MVDKKTILISLGIIALILFSGCSYESNDYKLKYENLDLEYKELRVINMNTYLELRYYKYLALECNNELILYENLTYK